MSEFSRLQERAMDIRLRYNRLNKQQGRKSWGASAYTAGFVGDVGTLVKLVMAKEGYRSVKGDKAIDVLLQHELGDCLWSLFVIAEHYGINLETAFLSTMAELDERISRGQE